MTLKVTTPVHAGPERSPAFPAAGDTLRATIERVIHATEDGWGILAVEAEDGELHKVTGHIGHLAPGEHVAFSGEWTTHPRYGRQFKISTYRVERPTSSRGIERYLGQIDGVGPVTARALVQAFGADALRTIEDSPQLVQAVPGVGPIRAESIVQAVMNRKATDDTAIALMGYGVPQRFVAAILKRWGAAAVEQLRADPYQLIGLFSGLGFKTADQVARAVGVPMTSPQRVAAGLLHTLNEAGEGEGHTFLPVDDLLGQAARLLELRVNTLRDPLAALDEAGHVVVEEGGAFTRRLHAHECQVAERLRAISSTPSRTLELPEDVEHQGGLVLSDDQQAAVAAALSNDAPFVLVVTGGPGTGKTTVTRLLVENFLRAGLSVRLAAPTGRAARRLAEATGREASTIHRLLEYNPAAGGFTRNRSNQLSADVVVVDEASMVDVTLARHLLQAVPDASRLVLVGDVDQLPSVGPGRVLADVIDSVPVTDGEGRDVGLGIVRVVRLRQVFRQALDSQIVVNAHRINGGRPPVEEGDAEQLRDFYLVHREDAKAAAEMVELLVTERIPARFGFDPLTEIQVLCPMNKGDLGTKALNQRLQQRLNPDGRQLGNRQLRVGDRVMVTRNAYDLDVFNGDVGRIVEWFEQDKEAIVDFGDGRTVAMEGAHLSDLVLAYAATIHKSQGSEYPAVVLLCHEQAWIMLQRNLLYTGMTRARKLLVLVGTDKAIRHAARRAQGAERHSRLVRRLREPAFGRRPAQDGGGVFFKVEAWRCEDCEKVFRAKNPESCPECGGLRLESCPDR